MQFDLSDQEEDLSGDIFNYNDQFDEFAKKYLYLDIQNESINSLNLKNLEAR